jgi:hypothetical protein
MRRVDIPLKKTGKMSGVQRMITHRASEDKTGDVASNEA